MMMYLGILIALCFGLASLATCQSNDPCERVKCAYGAQCQTVNGKAECVCPTFCPQYIKSFCGSDGNTYGNPCFLKVHNCKAKTNITMASDGPCPQKTTTTSSPSSPTYRRCPIACPQNILPFCGSDGQTYGNPCFLALTNCRQRTNVTKVSDGACPSKATTTTQAPQAIC